MKKLLILMLMALPASFTATQNVHEVIWRDLQARPVHRAIRQDERAGGHTHDDLEMYTQTMCKRIAELGAL